MSDWHRLGISELQAAFLREEFRPSQYLDHMLQRIDAFNPELNAFLELDRTGAKAAAEESDRRFQEDEQRPLEGIVIGVKANIAVAGLELHAGSDARRGIVAREDAGTVEKLRNAGAIIVGSLNTHEMAMGATTNNPWFGACYNPYGTGLTPGGSSGGSASAVAAALCTASLGSDSLGSVRIPAAYCGIYGLKPTFGAGSSSGLVPACNRFDTIGPMARSLEDLSMLSHILFSPDLSTAMRRSQFLHLANMGGIEVGPAMSKAFEAVLADLPAPSGYVTLPHDANHVRGAGFVMMMREFIVHLVQLGEERCGRFSPDLEFLIDYTLSRSDEDVAEGARLVDEVAAIICNEISSSGILITPTVPQTAFLQTDRAPSNQAAFTALANIAGLPALTLPMGLDEQGRPMGVQLTGPAGGEAMLIAQARMINDKVRGYVPPPRFY